MDYIGLAKLIIILGQAFVGSLTAAGAPKELIDGAAAGLAKFQEVHGTLVVKAQVDANTLVHKW